MKWRSGKAAALPDPTVKHTFIKTVLKRTFIFAVCACVLVCAWRLDAAEVAAQPATATIHDVSLNVGASLQGVVKNTQGAPMRDVDVLLTNARGLSLKTKTDAEGRFEFSNLRGGVYQVQANHAAMTVRVWGRRAAPPAAIDQLLIVVDSAVARGQVPQNGWQVIYPIGIVTGAVLGVRLGDDSEVRPVGS